MSCCVRVSLVIEISEITDKHFFYHILVSSHTVITLLITITPFHCIHHNTAVESSASSSGCQFVALAEIANASRQTLTSL